MGARLEKAMQDLAGVCVCRYYVSFGYLLGLFWLFIRALLTLTSSHTSDEEEDTCKYVGITYVSFGYLLGRSSHSRHRIPR